MANPRETPAGDPVDNLTLRQLIDYPDALLGEDSVSGRVNGERQNNEFVAGEDEIENAAAVLHGISSPARQVNMAPATRNNPRTGNSNTEDDDDVVVETVDDDFSINHVEGNEDLRELIRFYLQAMKLAKALNIGDDTTDTNGVSFDKDCLESTPY